MSNGGSFATITGKGPRSQYDVISKKTSSAILGRLLYNLRSGLFLIFSPGSSQAISKGNNPILKALTKHGH